MDLYCRLNILRQYEISKQGLLITLISTAWSENPNRMFPGRSALPVQPILQLFVGLKSINFTKMTNSNSTKYLTTWRWKLKLLFLFWRLTSTAWIKTMNDCGNLDFVLSHFYRLFVSWKCRTYLKCFYILCNIAIPNCWGDYLAFPISSPRRSPVHRILFNIVAWQACPMPWQFRAQGFTGCAARRPNRWPRSRRNCWLEIEVVILVVLTKRIVDCYLRRVGEGWWEERQCLDTVKKYCQPNNDLIGR